MWEDDAKRDGMRRRGPSKTQFNESAPEVNLPFGNIEGCGDPDIHIDQAEDPHEDNLEDGQSFREPGTHGALVLNREHNPQSGVGIQNAQLAFMPPPMGNTELLLLGNYVQRFTRSYPTCTEPSNPFLSVFLPLAMQDNLAMNSMLLLSSAQATHVQWTGREKDILRLRQKALSGIREFIGNRQPSSSKMIDLDAASQRSGSDTTIMRLHDSRPSPDRLVLLACAIMLLLHEKISGEATWKPHFEFVQRLGVFEHFNPSQPNPGETTNDALQFFHSLFLYNDLVRATSLDIPMSSTFYLDACDRDPYGPTRSRYYFPSLVARISFDDGSVSESDIGAWDGNMNWLPSFALSRSMESHRPEIESDDELALKRLYQTAAVMYMYRRRHRRGDDERVRGITATTDLSKLARQAIQLSESIPISSPFENALLWPLGIAARELSSAQLHERNVVLRKFEGLEQRLGMRHFQRVRGVLTEEWAARDNEAQWPRQEGPGNLILLG